jgi:hypothetical protein
VKNWKLSSLVVLATLVGCKQNPLPTDGTLLKERPPVKQAVLPPLLLEMPETVEFFEGKPGEFEIKATVPTPGLPVVTIEGLPEAAIFDATTGKVTWTPGFQDANNERDPRSAEKAYPLRVFLRSSEDKLTYVQRPLVVLVRDIPRSFKVTYPKPAGPVTPAPPVFPAPPVLPAVVETLEEGKTIEREIVVQSEDFPKGPFDLRAQGLPEGASLKLAGDGSDPKKYVFSYSPGALTVDLNTVTAVSEPSVNHTVEFIATDPAGRIAKVDVGFKVKDKRMDPQIAAPEIVEQGLNNIYFTFRADDLNGEVAPKIVPEDPGFGNFVRKREKEVGRTPNSNPWSLSSIHWTDVPADKAGTTHELVFHVCVQKSRNNYEYCTDSKVKVSFTRPEQLPPLVDRKEFPVGVVKYVKQNEAAKFALPVRGQERPTPAKPAVTITPAEEGISWAANQLSLELKTTGLKQFVLIAKSPFGGSVSEGFLVEALPWSWSKNLILGESPQAEEVKRMQGFVDEAGVANSALQLGEPRTLALRQLLMVGTTGLSPKEVVDSVEQAASKVKHVMILTPLVETLKGPVATELADLKVAFKSRVRNLADYKLEVTGNTLQRPADAIKLKGDLSAESKEPVPMDLSQVAAGMCEPLLKLVNSAATPAEDLVVAAKCQRKSQGTLVVSGVEWADIELGSNDRGLMKKWMSNLGLGNP